MIKEKLLIDGIPAVMWGESSNRMFIAVHGQMSNKSDVPIEMLAEVAIKKGYQVLSFDLPEHGERKGERKLAPEQVFSDLKKVFDFAKVRVNEISLFACSIGAYYSMVAYTDFTFEKVLFLSPIVDMKRLIEKMMKTVSVTPQQLEKEKFIPTDFEPLEWGYYQWVLSHPIVWEKRTSILYGKSDEICDLKTISNFTDSTGSNLTMMEDGEHWFHTKEQLEFLLKWYKKQI